MAKIIGAAFSLSATGSIGQQINFQNPHGTGIARRHAAPAKRTTTGQAMRRLRYKIAVILWHALTPLEQSEWQLTGRTAGMTGYNAFLRVRLNAPAAPAITPWDSSSTAWDAGATLWDII